MKSRFDWMLPKYLTKIADFDDLLEAEDQEFQRIEDRLLEVSADSTLTTMLSYDTLRRLEWIFAIKVKKEESFDQRVQRVKSKLVAYETTTVEAIERLAERITQVPAKVIEENENYYFRVEITLNEWRGILALVEAIHEIKPAHLGFRLDISFLTKKLYFSGLAQSYRTLTVDWNHVGDTETESKLTLGGAALMGRTLTVPVSVFDRSKVDDTIRTGGWIGMRRLIVCSTDR